MADRFLREIRDMHQIAERHPFVTESMPINWVLALARKTLAFSSDPV
jgi:hypothetical protein